MAAVAWSSSARADVAEWEPDDPAPNGFHVEKRPRVGLAIGGAATLASSYLFAASVVGQSDYDGTNRHPYDLLVPVAGPFIEMTQTRSVTLHVIYVFDGAAQVAGATMLTLAFALPRRVLVADGRGSALVVHPLWLGVGAAGIGASGVF